MPQGNTELSHNGWPTRPQTWNLPQITGAVRAGDVWVVFNWLANQYAQRVEAITKGHSWGYNYRKIAGSNSFSNHASGTAVDFNAPKHPLGTKASQNFSPTQIATCNQIIRESQDVLKWLDGHDPMHWEIRPGVQPHHVARLAATLLQRALGIPTTGIKDEYTVQKIKDFQSYHNLTVDGVDGPQTWAVLNGATQAPTAPTPTPPAPPKPAPPTAPTAPAYPLPNGKYFGPELPKSNSNSVSGYWNSGRRDKKGNPSLKLWQQRIKERGWNINPDGLYGDETKRIATAFQREKRLHVDGLIGPATWAAAWTTPVT